MSTLSAPPPSTPHTTSLKSGAEQIREHQKLQAEVFRRLHPRTYLERFLVEGIRPDARTALDFRDLSVNAGA